MAGQNYYNFPPPPPLPDLNNNHQSWNHPIPDRHPQYTAHNPNPTIPHSRLNMPPSMPYPNPNIQIRSNPHPPQITHPRSNLDRPSSSLNFHPEYPPHNTYPNPPSYNYYSEPGPSYLPPYIPNNFTENHSTENHLREHHRVALKRKNPELYIPPIPSYSSQVETRNWSYPVDDFQRNVRNRPNQLYASSSSSLDVNNSNNNNNLARNYGTNNATHQPFYSHGNVFGGPPERNSFSSYLPPPQTTNITDPSSYNYDINRGHHHARNNTVQTMTTEPSYHPQNRNPNVPVPVTTHHSTITRSTFYENTNFAPPRVENHMAHQSYVANSASARWRHAGTDIDASSSRSRPVMFSDVSNNSGRIGNSNPGFRASSFRVDRAPSRWLLGQFGSGEDPLRFDSSDLFDQHRDMRMDIDSMSYEELLALEERIGYVNIGLPDERISKCLKEFNYINCNQDGSNEEEQERCVICLESYEEGEEVGRLKCAHDFHTGCIKKWLQMKNVCPVCKSVAFQDSS